MKREIINPRWANERKDQILAKFKYENGNVVTAAISVPPGGRNPDWDEIVETFGIDRLDENLEKDLSEHRKRKAMQAEAKRQEMEFARAEVLFGAKAEAFDISVVKNSSNKKLKNKIRKASSIMEVTAYTTALILSEDPAILEITKPAEPVLIETTPETEVTI